MVKRFMDSGWGNILLFIIATLLFAAIALGFTVARDNAYVTSKYVVESDNRILATQIYELRQDVHDLQTKTAKSN